MPELVAQSGSLAVPVTELSATMLAPDCTEVISSAGAFLSIVNVTEEPLSAKLVWGLPALSVASAHIV